MGTFCQELRLKHQKMVEISRRSEVQLVTFREKKKNRGRRGEATSARSSVKLGCRFLNAAGRFKGLENELKRRCSVHTRGPFHGGGGELTRYSVWDLVFGAETGFNAKTGNAEVNRCTLKISPSG